MRSPEHLVPDAAPVSSQRLQAPSRHHGPALYQPVNYRSRGQSALISGFPLSAILGKPFPAKAADTPNPHRRPNAHRFPAGSFFGGFRTPALYPGSTARDAPASETLHDCCRPRLRPPRSAIVKGFRMPASHCTRDCTEAGVRKASKEETAGEYAPAAVSVYGDLRRGSARLVRSRTELPA